MGVSGPRRPTSAPCQRRCRPGPADATRTTGDQRGAAGCAGTAAAAGACRGWGDGGAGLAQRGLEEDKGVSEVGECGGVGGGLEKGILVEVKRAQSYGKEEKEGSQGQGVPRERGRDP